MADEMQQLCHKMGDLNQDPFLQDSNDKTLLPSIYRFKVLGDKGNNLRDTQDFYALQDQYLQSGRLFEDPEFGAADSSLFFSQTASRTFRWLRPHEIADSPEFIVEGASRFDIMQGELGDCWLLAAVANLTLNEKLFSKVVPTDQGFKDKYCGVFHFRFWQYGRWIDVVIDDRLPTVGGKLVYMHSSQPNEFWSALLEKAFAKLHGSYEALKGGGTSEAMEDFTGGVAMMFELNEPPQDMFQIMEKCFVKQSLMACAIEADPNTYEAETAEGLVKGHAYSVTSVKYVDIATPSKRGKIPLIRLRNPWGQTEWKGAWSDQSTEWRYISEEDKRRLGLIFEHDGEFWLSYQDFVKQFDRLEVCLVDPNSLPQELRDPKKRWEMSVFEGEWVRGVTAGGCRNYLDTFHYNPQYRITLEDSDDDENNLCTIFVALMQKNRRALRKVGAECLTIGFVIYKLENPDSLPKPLNMDFFRTTQSYKRCNAFVNLREVTCRFQVPPGVYCIIPSTFESNQQGEFILRVFSEKENNLQENDEELEMGEVDDEVKEKLKPKDDTEEEKRSERIREFFRKIAGEDLEVDWMELKEILDYAMKNEIPRSDDSQISSILSCICGTMCRQTPFSTAFETHRGGFSKDVCRSMVAMMDIDRSGKLGFEEFKKLWLDIQTWHRVFKLHEKGNSGYLSPFELREALRSAGYHLNAHVLNIVSHRYGTKDGLISFDDFMMCAVRLKSMIEIFQARAAKNDTASFHMDEWIETTLYS